MKYIFRLINALLIIVVASFSALAGFASLNVLNSTVVGEKEVIDKNESVTSIINRKMVTAFDEIEDSGKINFTFSETDIEAIAYRAIQKINENSTTIKITGVSVKNDHGAYTLQLSIKYYYSTVATLGFTIKDLDDYIVLHFNSMKVGNLSVDDLLFKLVVGFFTPETIEQAFSSLGITCEVDLDDKTMKIKRSDITSKMDEMVKNLNNDFVSLAYDLTFKNDNLVTFDYGSDNSKIGIIVDISDTKYDKAIQYPLAYNVNLSHEKDICEQILSDKELKASYAESIMPYLITGYNSLTDEQKGVIDSLDLTNYIQWESHSWTQKEYPGAFIKSEDNFDTLIHDKVTLVKTIDPTGKITATADIPSEIFNAVINTTNTLKSSTIVYSNDDINSFSFSSIEQISIYIDQDTFAIDLIDSLNGFKSVIQLVFKTIPSNGFNIKTKLDSIKFGTISLTDSQIKSVMKFMSSMVDSSLMEIDDQNNIITFKLDEKVESIDGVTEILTSCPDCEKTTTFTSEGNLQIKMEGTPSIA